MAIMPRRTIGAVINTALSVAMALERTRITCCVALVPSKGEAALNIRQTVKPAASGMTVSCTYQENISPGIRRRNVSGAAVSTYHMFSAAQIAAAPAIPARGTTKIKAGTTRRIDTVLTEFASAVQPVASWQMYTASMQLLSKLPVAKRRTGVETDATSSGFPVQSSMIRSANTMSTIPTLPAATITS